MINLHESMVPGRDRTRDPWICSQTRICNQTRYRLRYAARLFIYGTMIVYGVKITTLVSYHRFAIGVKRQCQMYLQSVYGLLRELLLHFLTKGVHTYHNYCLWCVNYKVRYISPLWPWSQRLIRICLTVACF